MAWTDIQAKLVWRSPTNTWPTVQDGNVTDVSESDKAALLGYLQALYSGSTTAAGLLNTAAAAGDIRIGTSDPGNPGFVAGNVSVAGSYVGLNLAAINQLHYFNTTGRFVQEKPAITVAHEFIHFVLGSSYADPVYSEAAMNGVSYDFDGNIIRKQNEIAGQMGFTDNLQVSYHSSVMSTDARFSSLTVGQSYSDGNSVDVVRLGDDQGNVTIDSIDHTSRTDKLRDLIFGFGGDDSIKSGKGDDYVYGGEGKDKLWGGDGNDMLAGEDGDDEIRGEKGDDKIWGGAKDAETGRTDGIDKVFYDTAPAAITITLGGSAVPTLSVQDGDGGTDTLHSIEKIEGSIHGDTLIVQALTAEIGAAFDYIDLGASDQDKIDISALVGSATVDLRDPQQQTVTLGGAILKLKNAENVVGGGDDDIVHLPTTAASTVTAGAGDDTVYLAGSGHTVDGGGGYDVLNLSAVVAGSRIDMASGTALLRGSGTSGFGGFEEVVGTQLGDVMYGDGSGTKLVSGGGASYLEGSGTDVLAGGSGDTYFSLTDGGTAISGAGNDYFEASGSAPVTIKFGVGSGHDMLGSYFEPGGLGVDNDGWIATRQSDMIWLEGLTRDDIELVWDYTEVGGATPGSGTGADYDDWYRTGEAAIRIRTTGDTLYLGELSYNLSDYQAEYLIYFYSLVSYDYDKMAERAAYNISAGINPDRQWHLYLYENNEVDDDDRSVELAIFSFDGVTRLNIFDLFDLSEIDSQPLPGTVKAASDILSRLDQGGEPGFVKGGPGADDLAGSGGGDDLFGDEGDDALDAGAGDDFVRGGGGNDVIVGGAGADSLHGGSGRDTVDYSWTVAGTAVDLAAGTAAGAEIDTDRLISIEDVLGGAGNDSITGDGSANSLSGGAGDDILIGGAGDDTLIGGAGADQLQGGAGWDTYVWRLGDGSDVLIDQAATTTYAENTLIVEGAELSAFVVGRNPQTMAGALTLIATGEIIFIPGLFAGTGAGILDVVFRSDGNSAGTRYFVDSLAALAVDDSTLGDISGTEGADTLTGTPAEDRLYGLGGNDVLSGGAGNDLLDGGAGQDRMEGGPGDDILIVDNLLDLAVEAPDEGIDTVYSSVTYTLGANIEKLTLTGTAAIDGTGNALDNVLTGNSAANTLSGLAGADTMIGGDGNDIYIVDDAGDTVIESSASGGIKDVVKSSVGYTLGDHVENLTLTGPFSTAIDGAGNALDNVLTGNGAANVLSGGASNDRIEGRAGDDQLFGGAGNDILYGQDGADGFWFDSALDAQTNVDRLSFFSPLDDTIYLSGAIFAAAGPNGALAAAAFHAGAAAADADDRILYDSTTGRIYYDADGSGAGAAILFAQVEAGTALTDADFVIYG